MRKTHGFMHGAKLLSALAIWSCFLSLAVHLLPQARFAAPVLEVVVVAETLACLFRMPLLPFYLLCHTSQLPEWNTLQSIVGEQRFTITSRSRLEHSMWTASLTRHPHAQSPMIHPTYQPSQRAVRSLGTVSCATNIVTLNTQSLCHGLHHIRTSRCSLKQPHGRPKIRPFSCQRSIRHINDASVRYQRETAKCWLCINMHLQRFCRPTSAGLLHQPGSQLSSAVFLADIDIFSCCRWRIRP